MKKDTPNADKELYQQLRRLPADALWTGEVARFDQADLKERLARVAVIRAVGVAFASAGSAEQRADVRAWLVRLLDDPAEKIRRYAMAALPKLGAGPVEEAALLALLQRTTIDREKTYLGQALDKIGGAATLEVVSGATEGFSQTVQKVKASVARANQPSVILMTNRLTPFTGFRIHLRGRKGLESIVSDEIKERFGARGPFRVDGVSSGLVALTPVSPFTLKDLYTLRCFGTANFVLGSVMHSETAAPVDAIATAITSPQAKRLMTALTKGAMRYRLEFVSKSHQRGAVRQVANRAFALCPEILNDARSAPWAVDVHPMGKMDSVELRPRLYPDPRLYYRRQDIAAASHPPLAACMARLAGNDDGDIVWDPFCGSGSELIERALLGGVRRLIGTDVSSAAVAIARANVAAANMTGIETNFVCCDFREFSTREGMGPNSVSLIISNPPLGRRIRIDNLRSLFADLFAVATTVLRPGGRLVFANPMKIEPRSKALELQSRRTVDLGGFDCRLELYRKRG